jgi:hypothetical protein
MGNVETNLRGKMAYEFYDERTDERSMREFNKSLQQQKRSFNSHNFHYSETHSHQMQLSEFNGGLTHNQT